MRISAISNVNYRSKTQKRIEISSGFKALPCDTVSFKGGIKGVQISKRVINYGDIFVEGAKLIDENLPMAKKVGAYLANADLSGSNLQKGSFFGAMFDNANLTGANFSDSNLSSAQFLNTKTNHTFFNRCNLSNATFEGDNFGPWTSLQNSNIFGADFRDADMSCFNMYGALFDEYTRFSNGFDPAEFNMYLFIKGANLSGISDDFKYAKLRHNAFEDMNFSNSSLKRADMKASKFVNCNMHNTILTRAYAKETVFIDVDMSNAKLKQAQLTGAELINVDLKNANLKGALLDWSEIKDVNLRGAKYNSETVFKEGFEPKAAGMIFEN